MPTKFGGFELDPRMSSGLCTNERIPSTEELQCPRNFANFRRSLGGFAHSTDEILHKVQTNALRDTYVYTSMYLSIYIYVFVCEGIPDLVAGLRIAFSRNTRDVSQFLVFRI